MTTYHRILVIDDEQQMRDIFAITLQGKKAEDPLQEVESRLFATKSPELQKLPDYEVVTAASAKDGIARVEQALQEQRPFSVAFIDVRLPPGPDGVWAAEKIREIDPYMQIVIVTAYSDVDVPEITLRVPPEDKLLFMLKPIHPQEIRQFASALSAKWKSEQDVRRMQAQLENTVQEQRKDLKRQTELLEYVFSRVEEGIGIVDLDEQFIFVNPAMGKIFDIDPAKLIGKNVAEFLDKSQNEKVQQETERRKNNESSTYELNIVTAERKQKILRVSAYPWQDETGQMIGSFGVMADITEQRALQEQLLQTQKMEALGALASGVAHDFNNVLAVISGSAQILGLWAQSQQQKHLLSEIEKSVEHASSLTHQLLIFSRKHKMQRQVIDVKEILDDITPLLRRLLTRHIQLHIESGDVPVRVFADPGQLRQILMNLVVNARDAIPEQGDIFVRLGRELNHTSPHVKGMKEADYVWLEVEDTGTGMDDATRKKIFEPFFTTKPEGKGTGLGLSTVYGIVQRHDGYIELHSQQGQGTRFRMWIPCVQCPAQSDE